MAVVVGIAAKPGQPRATALCNDLVVWLNQRGIRWLIEDARLLDPRVSGAHDPDRVVPRDKLTSHCRLIVVLGGDGTLISVCRHPTPEPPLIVGVNLGTLGFLTEITTDSLFSVLELALAGTAESDERTLLSVELERGSSTVLRTHAINDVVITKEAIARIFSLDFSVDGQTAATIRGDGVIVASPSGSTAYSLAAGGSIVHPSVDAILLTPICPHSLTLRPLILPGRSKVVLEVSNANKFNGNEVYLTVDGQEGCALHAGDRVIITGSTHKLRMVRSPHVTYFDVLANKLKWAHQ